MRSSWNGDSLTLSFDLDIAVHLWPLELPPEGSLTFCIGLNFGFFYWALQILSLFFLLGVRKAFQKSRWLSDCIWKKKTNCYSRWKSALLSTSVLFGCLYLWFKFCSFFSPKIFRDNYYHPLYCRGSDCWCQCPQRKYPGRAEDCRSKEMIKGSVEWPTSLFTLCSSHSEKIDFYPCCPKCRKVKTLIAG